MGGRLDGHLPKAVLQFISTCLSRKIFSLPNRNVDIYCCQLGFLRNPLFPSSWKNNEGGGGSYPWRRQLLLEAAVLLKTCKSFKKNPYFIVLEI